MRSSFRAARSARKWAKSIGAPRTCILTRFQKLIFISIAIANGKPALEYIATFALLTRAPLHEQSIEENPRARFHRQYRIAVPRSFSQEVSKVFSAPPRDVQLYRKVVAPECDVRKGVELVRVFLKVKIVDVTISCTVFGTRSKTRSFYLFATDSRLFEHSRVQWHTHTHTQCNTSLLEIVGT